MLSLNIFHKISTTKIDLKNTHKNRLKKIDLLVFITRILQEGDYISPLLKHDAKPPESLVLFLNYSYIYRLIIVLLIIIVTTKQQLLTRKLTKTPFYL